MIYNMQTRYSRLSVELFLLSKKSIIKTHPGVPLLKGTCVTDI